MKRILSLAILLMLVFQTRAITVVDSIFAGGQYRSFRLYVPSSYTGTAAWPLVLNLHGYTSNAANQQLYANMDMIADTAHFLIVYPQGTMYMGQPYWNAGFGTGTDDIGFLSQLIDSISASYNVDPNSVYSCGLSNGGYMSYTLACALSNKIAAIASVAGSMTVYQYTNCTPPRPVPAMQIHGTADGTVPYNGMSGTEPIDTVVKFWVNHNSCNPTAAFSNVPNTSISDGCTAEHYVYTGGESGSSVELYKIINGGHTWPGSPFVVGTTNQDFKASEKIWLFFRKYKLNLLTGVSEIPVTAELAIYPNPATSYVNIDAADFLHATVYDMSGRVVVKSTERRIATEMFASGMYTVCVVQKNGVLWGKVLIANSKY